MVSSSSSVGIVAVVGVDVVSNGTVGTEDIEGGVITYYAFFEEEEMPEELKEYALAAAKTWDLYNTNDASLEEVEKYVVKDGFYDVIARRWL